MILDVEPGLGRSYFLGHLHLTDEQYFKFTIKLEVFQTIFTLVLLSYFLICQHEVSLIDNGLIINFEVSYLLIGNAIPLMCLKCCQHLYNQISISHDQWQSASSQSTLGENLSQNEL